MSEGRAPITPTQRELYDLILDIREHRGEFPSQRYLAQYLGLNLKTVQDRLMILWRRGWLETPTPDGVGTKPFLINR